MRRLLPLAGLALAFLFLGGITLRTLRAVEAPSDPAERKLAEAKRYLYYIVTRSEGPEFQLAGHERDLYIVSHGVLPGAPPFDPARQLTYGLRLSALLDGKEVWARELYTRSRQSKARRAGGVWLDEAAFSLERGVEVTDDRLLVARLPDDLPAGAVLRFRLAGDSDGEALVRVYERTPRAAARVELRLRSLAPSEREELAAALSFTPWDRLDGAERTARLRSRRLRMSAVGREGQGYRTRALHVSDFRLPLDEEAPQAGTLGRLVSPARSAALNIVGPVELRLVVARGPADQPSLVPAALEIRWIGEGGQPPPLVLPVPPAPTEVTQTVSVPAGLHSLHLHTDAREGVRVALTAPAGSQAQLGVPATPGAEEPLLPHEALLWGTVLAKDTLPLVLSVPGDELIERIVRVDARLLPEAAPPESPVGGALTVETFDHAGRRLTRQEVQLASQVSRFEEVRLTGVALPRPVAEPASFRLIAPAGARRIVVQAAQPTFVRAHALATLSPEPDALEAPFDAVQLQSTVWRHAPLDERSWLPLQPLNRAALADREARLAAQVRLEPAPEATAAAGGAATTLAPDGETERQVILEKADGWEDGHQLRLRPGRPVRVKIGGPARLAYAAAEKDLGREVLVSVDGRELARFTVATTRSSWELPPVPAGIHTVEVAGPDLRLLLDQPPAAGGEVVALRSVYRASGKLRLHVRKPGAAPAVVNLVVYAPGRDGDPSTRLRVRVDGGAPRRVEGMALAQLTPGTRTYPLPPADREPVVGFADGGDRTVYHPRLIAVGLGDDVGAGGHTLEIEPLGRGGNLWMRFFVMSSSRREPERAIQWKLSSPRAGAGE